MPGAGDDEWWAHADELVRLVEDDLDPARVGLAGGEFACLLGRLDSGELDDAALDLRDRLLRDDDDVPVCELASLGDQRSEVVSLLQLWQSLDRHDGEAWPDVLDED